MILIKFLILLTRNSSFFSVKYLRNFRWFLYRKAFKANQLYVDDRVVITTAHKNPNGSFLRLTGEINIGQDVYIDYSGGISIGDRVAISESVKIFTHNHSINKGGIDWKKNEIIFSSLEIEDFTWLGAGSVILPSVGRIAKGSIVAAGAILTKDTDTLGIYAGNPAKKIGIRKIDDNEK